MSTTYTPRFDILIAKTVPFALIIRHGPRNHACSIGWNLKNNTFTIGQWINARILPCDLSPDGRYFLYSGYRPWDVKREDGMENWVAISRTPYLKAIGLWQCGFGGGIGSFDDNKHYQLSISNPTELVTPTELTLRRDDGNAHASELGHQVPRNPTYGSPPWVLKREIPKSELRPKSQLFEKPAGNGFVLHYYNYLGAKPTSSLGTIHGDYQFVDAINNDYVISGRGWAWADVIDGRLLCLENARIYETDADRIDLKNARMLYDMSDLQFEPIAAPY